MRAPPRAVATVQTSFGPAAGLQDRHHYEKRLSSGRYRLRELLLPLIRCETPPLARLQSLLRCSLLDSYFAFTANLGTLTFYLIFLPVVFWSGYTAAGRAIVHMLALGVILSGWIKDYICLPRPLSPPLQRITMSKSSSLEYGFPSTHSTNCVSIVLYVTHHFNSGASDVSGVARIPILSLCYLFMATILGGRLYCGMHGFSDVIGGGTIGAIVAFAQIRHGAAFDQLVSEDDSMVLWMLLGAVVICIRLYPEPADDCPCFDDSVAFAGVLLGINTGHWQFCHSPVSSTNPVPGTIPYSIAQLGVLLSGIRIILGVSMVVLWRSAAKSTLLMILPPLYRRIESLGLGLPRRYFVQASQYEKVPPLRADDNILPSVTNIPKLIAPLQSGRLRRAISIGPQSEADVRELYAQLELQTRSATATERSDPFDAIMTKDEKTSAKLRRRAVSSVDKVRPPQFESFATRFPTSGRPERAPDIAEPRISFADAASSTQGSHHHRHHGIPAIEKPRVRYDVEVVTKLVVYAGIGWIAVYGSPVVFYHLGL